MKCLICDKSSKKSLSGASKAVCSDCENKKRCKECNILKTGYYKYKNGKTYSTCIECFNERVKCEFCNKEFKKTYLSKHIEMPFKKVHLNEINNDKINLNNENDNNHEIDTATLALHNIMFNRTLIVGPSFCGKTRLLLNKLQLIRLYDNEKRTKIITRSPVRNKTKNLDSEDTSCISVEEDLDNRTIQDFQN